MAVNNLVIEGDYIHMKTGNIYEYMNLVHPVDKEPSEFTMLIHARCSENQDIQVKVYCQEEQYFYVTHDNPQLFENTKVKVLYLRNGILWLRSEEEFHKIILLNGQYTPRFKKSNADFKTVYASGDVVLHEDENTLAEWLESSIATLTGADIPLMVVQDKGKVLVIPDYEQLSEKSENPVSINEWKLESLNNEEITNIILGAVGIVTLTSI